jgi:hypothetical protein
VRHAGVCVGAAGGINNPATLQGTSLRPKLDILLMQPLGSVDAGTPEPSDMVRVETRLGGCRWVCDYASVRLDTGV